MDCPCYLNDTSPERPDCATSRSAFCPNSNLLVGVFFDELKRPTRLTYKTSAVMLVTIEANFEVADIRRACAARVKVGSIFLPSTVLLLRQLATVLGLIPNSRL